MEDSALPLTDQAWTAIVLDMCQGIVLISNPDNRDIGFARILPRKFTETAVVLEWSQFSVFAESSQAVDQDADHGIHFAQRKSYGSRRLGSFLFHRLNMGIRVSFTSMTFRRTASVIIQNCSTSLPFDPLLLPRYACQNTYLTLNNLAASISYLVWLLLLSQPIYPNCALVLVVLHLALRIAPLKQSAPRVGDLFFLLISGIIFPVI